MNKKVVYGLIVAIVLVLGGVLVWRSFLPRTVEAPTDNGEVQETDQEETSSGEEETAPGAVGFQGEVLAGDESPLLVFNQEDYQKALETDRLVVLYFYANWCPICKEEVQNALYPAFNELEGSDVVGFRVNYRDSDTEPSEEDLAREFGIAYQHTKVFVKDGQQVLKAPDSWSKGRYISEIEGALGD